MSQWADRLVREAMGEGSRAGERPGATGLERAVALGVAAVVLAIGLAGAQRSRELNLERRHSADLAALAEVATGVAVDLERGLDAVGSAAQAVSVSGPAAAGPRAAARVPAATSFGFVPGTDGLPPSPAGATAPPPETLADPAVVSLLDRARDSGDAAAVPLEGEAGEARLALAAPVYAPEAAPGPPRTVPDRRERLVGWVASVVDLTALARPYAPAGAVAAVRPPAARAGAEPDELAGLPSQRIEVGGRPLTVTAGDPSGVPWIAPTILLVIATGLAAAAAAIGVLAVGRRLREQQAEIARSTEQVRLVGEVAPLVQQSLELGEVLPAVAVQLTDHFGLVGVRLSTTASSSGQLELFSLGQRLGRSPKPVLQPPAQLAAGEGLTLALQRGGRSVALLEVTAGRDLDDADLQSLRAITELVTAAVVNASLYASQQVAVRRLRDLDALKTVFLSTASHELRTPATAIGGFAGLLASSWDRFTDAQRRDFAERIAANARSLSDVVQDLLDFSLLDRGDVPLPVVPLELGALVEGVVDRLAPVCSDHVIDFSAEPAPPVAGAHNGLERVVTNLLTNAVKFSPSGSTITVAVRPHAGGAVVEVSDEGPGVPTEERQRVFTRFYRGSGDAVLQTRGVGIGLSVVSELVGRMGGEITLDDAPGGGARFAVWLPAAVSLDDVTMEAQDATTG